MPTPIVEIDNLTKDYETGFWRKRKTRALDGLSLTVESGQISIWTCATLSSGSRWSGPATVGRGSRPNFEDVDGW